MTTTFQYSPALPHGAKDVPEKIDPEFIQEFKNIPGLSIFYLKKIKKTRQKVDKINKKYQ